MRGMAALCDEKKLDEPVYDVIEHSLGQMPTEPGSTETSEQIFSCVVYVGDREFATTYVYKAEENAKEKAAKKAFDALSSS